MTELDPDDMAILARFTPRSETRLAGRRARETRPLATADRKIVTTADVKDQQLNVRVSKAFKRQALAFADAKVLPLVGLIERAVNLYMMQEQVRGQ
jgi:hypothetical protein